MLVVGNTTNTLAMGSTEQRFVVTLVNIGMLDHGRQAVHQMSDTKLLLGEVNFNVGEVEFKVPRGMIHSTDMLAGFTRNSTKQHETGRGIRAFGTQPRPTEGRL
jgi:hypothetical protein